MTAPRARRTHCRGGASSRTPHRRRPHAAALPRSHRRRGDADHPAARWQPDQTPAPRTLHPLPQVPLTAQASDSLDSRTASRNASRSARGARLRAARGWASTRGSVACYACGGVGVLRRWSRASRVGATSRCIPQKQSPARIAFSVVSIIDRSSGPLIAPGRPAASCAITTQRAPEGRAARGGVESRDDQELSPLRSSPNGRRWTASRRPGSAAGHSAAHCPGHAAEADPRGGQDRSPSRVLTDERG